MKRIYPLHLEIPDLGARQRVPRPVSSGARGIFIGMACVLLTACGVETATATATAAALQKQEMEQAQKTLEQAKQSIQQTQQAMQQRTQEAPEK